ncbi:MAG: DMT family transporter [Succinivibrio sp.]
MFELRQYLLLFLTATIWGSGFIGQKLGIAFISPFAFTFFRTFIGGVCLIPIIILMRRINVRLGKECRTDRKMLFLGSLSCGFFLIMSESFQQFGLLYTDVNKASFITSLYMVFVPLFGVFAGHKITFKLSFAVALSTFGLYLFCMKGSFSLKLGDLLILMCAIGFAFHILVISYFINHVDGVMLSCGQFFCASLMGFFMMIFDGVPPADNLYLALPAILYVGIMSNGVAYTLQIVGQRGINPAIASLIMSLESVMGAVFGVLFLNEIMTLREITGAALMFTAVILTQLKLSFRNKNKHVKD